MCYNGFPFTFKVEIVSMIKRSILPLASFAAVLLLSGCATDQLQRDIAEVRQVAQDAKASSERAQMSADAAMAKADDASAKAEEASTAAQAAQVCCQENQERLNRAWRKGMNK
jgi:hypothetical protein